MSPIHVSIISTVIVTVLLLHLGVRPVETATTVGPISNCTALWTPSQTPWTNTTRYIPYSSTPSPPWSVNSYDANQVSITASNISLACGFNTSLPYTNLTSCGYLSGGPSDDIGPFSHILIEFEWVSVPSPQHVPTLEFQKKTGSNGIDSLQINFSPLNDTTAQLWIHLYGPSPWSRSLASVPFPAIAGRHNISVVWDNQSVIAFFDSFANLVARIDRTVSDTYWITLPGRPSLIATYDDAINVVVNQPALTGPLTKYVIYTLQMSCISPHASDCFKPNPVPGVATCDIVEGIWRTRDLYLNDSSASLPPILNISDIALEANGTVILGSGLIVDTRSELNVTGTVILQGQLTIDLTNVSLSSNTTTLVLISYQNYSGRFDRIVTLSSDLNCPKYIADPYYGKDRFSVLLKPNLSSCQTKKRTTRTMLLIVGCTVGGVILLAIVVAVMLTTFCKNSRIFRRRVGRRRSLLAAM